MSDGKDSFVMYSSWIETFQMLNPDQGYKLIMMILEYSKEECYDLTDDPAVDIAFTTIKATLDRDREKYLETVKKRQAAGKLGGRPKKAQ